MIIVAHRGASRAEQENTLAAFRRAGQMGAAMVELDVRRTADDAMVVHHDAEITAMGPIVNHLRRILPDYVPSLAEALDACEGMEVNVEIKSFHKEPDYDSGHRLAHDVAELLMARGDHQRMLVSSFDPDALAMVRSVAPQLRTGFLYTRPTADPMERVAWAADQGHVALHPYHLGVNRAAVEAAHSRGLQVNTWTVDDPMRMLELRDWGVDGLITNVPDIAAATLSAR